MLPFWFSNDLNGQFSHLVKNLCITEPVAKKFIIMSSCGRGFLELLSICGVLPVILRLLDILKICHLWVFARIRPLAAATRKTFPALDSTVYEQNRAGNLQECDEYEEYGEYEEYTKGS